MLIRLHIALVVVVALGSAQDAQQRDVKHPELPKLVRNWAEKLGGELWHFGEFVTRRNTVIESFKHTQIVQEDGFGLLKDITERIQKMMESRVSAVKRIMEYAENVAETAAETVEESYEYRNAKQLINSAEPPKTDNKTSDDSKKDGEMNEDDQAQLDALRTEDIEYQMDQEQDESTANEEDDSLSNKYNIEVTDYNEPKASMKPPEEKSSLALYPHPQFYHMAVNTSYSAVHVPSNVYDRAPEVIKDIKWSEELDNTFVHNYKEDPTLSWQYFGSSTGFMRQFPAMIWRQTPVDLFDCRTRSWYIEAASSPKDVVILIDRSGSMTGMRREIARHVVNNILDTLGNNDYVNIFTFSNTTEPLVECFDDVLVQANLANVRMFKGSLPLFHTEQIANFSLALTTAFKLLKDYRDNRPGQGAQCNQAIMLITDGVYYNFKEIFKEYNWQNLPFMPVRVFTYLIGREVSDVREVKWMACANQGYYVHLSTYAEVREQVLQYIPVMARPMVLNPTLKPNPTWSPVYADAIDPKLTNYLWVKRERNKQRNRFLMYRRNRNRTLFFDEAMDKRFLYQQKKMDDEDNEADDEQRQIYRMMTSVSLPVYDRRKNATRVANLLGVAGTDVPMEYIQRLMLPYKLGVNGYAFIVTNNGYILTHPDLRPVFQATTRPGINGIYHGILKPSYNRVDVIEVEIVDDDTNPREFSDELIDFRNAIINQTTGKREFKVKTHIDDMNRIIFGKRFYHYMGIPNTPFSVVIALPERYGYYRIQHPVEDDPHRIRTNNKNLTDFFSGNWTVHPDWHYCRYQDNKRNFSSPEEELMHFLVMIGGSGWKWTPDCDRKLILKVVADAKITDWFKKNISTSNTEDNGHELIKRFGITVAFLATHSGLTRWQDFPQNIDNFTKDESHFHKLHNRAIDEIWYRRAVEHHYIQPRSFVYSIPFNVDYEDLEKDILVTASHAIFKEDKGRKAPAAVVGFQFYHSALYLKFRAITNNCVETNCKRTCSSAELYCLVIDDSGFIIVTYDKKNTGIFLGDFRPDIMKMLVDEGIYNRTRMYDYQATCFPNILTGNPASIFRNPIGHLAELMNWFVSTLLYFIQAVLANHADDFPLNTAEDVVIDEESSEEGPSRAFEKDFDHRLLINKTNPESCDNEFYLFSLNYGTPAINNNKSEFGDCNKPFLIHPVVGSNMMLLVINMLCKEQNVDDPFITLEPQEVSYNLSRQCHIVYYNNFPRRNYMSCINRSIHEAEIELCGRGSNTQATVLSILILLITLKLLT